MYSIVAVDFGISGKDHSKEHQKLWGYVLRLLGALPLVEGGGAKHSPPGQWGTPA